MENLEMEFLVQTCGLCEIICDKQDVPQHSCLEGYTQYITDPDTLYFYPLLDDGVTIVRKSKMANKEQVVATQFHKRNISSTPIQRRVLSEIDVLEKPLKKDKEGVRAKLNHDDEETLLLEVQLRQSLWNYKLPLPQRNMKIIRDLWQEVANALDGKITADEAKTKFKSLHDIYRKIIRAETCASGSARKENVKKWAHYHSMKFLRDSCLLKTTTSNIDLTDDVEDSDKTIEQSHESRKRKKEVIRRHVLVPLKKLQRHYVIIMMCLLFFRPLQFQMKLMLF